MSDKADGDSRFQVKAGRKGWAEIGIAAMGAVRGIAVDGKRQMWPNLHKLPPADRIKAVRNETGPTSLRLARTRYTFRGFVTACATAVAIVAILYVGRITINNVYQQVINQQVPPQKDPPPPSPQATAQQAPPSVTVEPKPVVPKRPEAPKTNTPLDNAPDIVKPGGVERAVAHVLGF
jgi:hypothetical protein